MLKFYFNNGTESKKKAVRTTIQKSARDDARREYEQGVGNRSGSTGPTPSKTRRMDDNPFDFVTWEDCANIDFQETKVKDGSDIRITFEGTGFGSIIGTEAQDKKKYKDFSMVLAGLADKYPPSPGHRRSTLHEFGHILGLHHEHQGPAAQRLLKLDEELVKKARGEENAQKNILDKVKKNKELWNYTNFDRLSIMM